MIEGDLRVQLHHLIPHPRPGEMVHPRRVRGEELRGAGRHPVGESVVVLLRWRNLPAHDEEHDVEDRHLLGQGGEVGEFAENVGKDFGQRMSVHASFGVEEGGDAGIGWADEIRWRFALGGSGLTFGEEVEEDTVEGAGGGDVADRDVVGDEGRLESFVGLGRLHTCLVWVDVCGYSWKSGRAWSTAGATTALTGTSAIE